MAILRPATTVAIAVTACCLLLAHAVHANTPRHCRYISGLLNSTAQDDRRGSFCRHEIPSTTFQTCCTQQLEQVMWTSTIDNYNEALHTVARSKLDTIDAYLRYLVDDHVLELAGKVDRIPHLLAETGNYKKEGEFWMESVNYTVSALFKRMAQNNATLRQVSVALIEQSETVIRYLMDQLILQRTITQPDLLELMRVVLFEWISDINDGIVYSLFQAKDIVGQGFIRTLFRYSRVVVALRRLENFWQAMLRNAAFPARGDLPGQSEDTMTQCLLSFMNLVKCHVCFIATKGYSFCPHVFSNQTTCLAAFLQPAEEGYFLLMTYYRAILMDYSLIYAEAAHQFTLRHLVNIKRQVNDNWFNIVNYTIQQYAKRELFTGNQEAQAKAYLNSLANKSFTLFTKEELQQPEVIPVAKQVTTPIISKTAKFADIPGQLSIMAPLHEALRRIFTLSLPIAPSNSSSACWNGLDTSGERLPRPKLKNVTYSAGWQAVFREMNDTMSCVICLIQYLPYQCAICSASETLQEYTTEPMTTTSTARPTRQKTGKTRTRSSTTTTSEQPTTVTTTTTTSTSTATTTTTSSTSTTTSSTMKVDYNPYISPDYGIVYDNDNASYNAEDVDNTHNIPDDEDIPYEASGKDYQDATLDGTTLSTVVITVQQTTSGMAANQTSSTKPTTTSTTTAATSTTSTSTTKNVTRRPIVSQNDEVNPRSHEPQSIKSGSRASCSFSIFSILLAYTFTSLYAYASRSR